MQFIFQYPDAIGTDSDMLDSGPVTDLAVAAETAGFGAIAFTEHPAPGVRWLESGGHQTLDPFVALSHAAAVTKTLRLLTYLTVVPYRNPSLLAKTAATVDKLSGGRLILGVGTGYLKGEFRALGVDFSERNTLFDEALDVLPLHWKGEPFSYEGTHFSNRDTIGRPKPVQDPIPIWIGGNAAITRRRVAERANGWMPLGGSEELHLTSRTPSVGPLNELAGLITDVKDKAGDRAAGLDFALAYSDPTIVDPGKDIERHREALGKIAGAGITWIMLPGPVGDSTATKEWVAAIGENYIGSH